MVDVKALHIGSHLRLKEPFVIPYLDGGTAVTEIIKANILTKSKIGFFPLSRYRGMETLHYVLVEEVDPIPITEELLKELGFIIEYEAVIKKPFFKLWLCDKYPIEITYWGEETNSKGKEWVVHVDNPDCSSIGGVDVQYLHELESFVYLCTGEELIRNGYEENRRYDLRRD